MAIILAYYLILLIALPRFFFFLVERVCVVPDNLERPILRSVGKIGVNHQARFLLDAVESKPLCFLLPQL